MDHLEALRLSAVEKYLLNELAPDVRDEFEEHYFGCRECATDLQATSAFMDAASQELKRHPVSKPVSSTVTDIPAVVAGPFPTTVPRKRNVVSFLLKRPAVIGLALAASLLVIVYQNVVVYPHLESQVAELRAPEILPTLSLAGTNSRGGSIPSFTVRAAHPYLLSLDIPAEDHYASYSCELHAPSGEILWRIPVTNEAAKDMVTIQAPAIETNSGRYVLVIRGNPSADFNGNSPGRSIELARDTFELSVQQ